jgi:hypothetical protein
VNATLVVARMCLREVARRRGVLLLLVLLPLSFYLVRRDQQGQSIRMLALGLGWAVSTLALFSSSAARSVDHRLRVTGYRTRQLLLGRLLAIMACGLGLAAGYGTLIALDQNVGRLWAIEMILVTTVLIAAPLGALVSAFVPGELEGALALLTVLAVQMLADPAGAIAKVLPFWSTREIGTYAIDLTESAYLTRGLAHFVATWIVLSGAALVVSAARLRLVRLPQPDPDVTEGRITSPGRPVR